MIFFHEIKIYEAIFTRLLQFFGDGRTNKVFPIFKQNHVVSLIFFIISRSSRINAPGRKAFLKFLIVGEEFSGESGHHVIGHHARAVCNNNAELFSYPRIADKHTIRCVFI